MPERFDDSFARALATWAVDFVPSTIDSSLADRALADTVAVALGGKLEPSTVAARSLSEAARWAVGAHSLDFDDLHVETTAHLSTVCVPLALSMGGGARTYLIAAGVMERVGARLGWSHYQDGWHITCTAGVFGAAAGAAAALGLSEGQIATALALAVPAAGGVQAAFGTDGKPLQVGFAVDAGIRAAQLAADGASADPAAVDQWLGLVAGGDRGAPAKSPAIPGRLAVKLFPCCYALQRPIQAIWNLGGKRPAPEEVTSVVVRAPESAVAPLIHHAPWTGLEGKFSLEYGIATALIDDFPGLLQFTDTAVQRDEAQRILQVVRTELTPGGSDLLEGVVSIELRLASGGAVLAELGDSDEIVFDQRAWEAKLAALGLAPGEITWESAPQMLRSAI